MDIKCPQCQSDNPETATFCADCGTNLTDHDDHIRNMIKQILFTAPGERANHPKFGCGLKLLFFEPDCEELYIKTQLLIQEELKKYLGDLIEVIEVKMEREESRFQITLVYIVRRTQQCRFLVFNLESNGL